MQTLTERRNFTQFYATKSERERNQRKEYEAQMLYRQGLQQFIDRWRYNANRGIHLDIEFPLN
jgi:ATP-binding cassette subfamily F protein 3